MLTGYLRQRRRTLLAFFLFGGIFAAAFALYQLPLRAVAYPFVLCAAAGAVLLTLDYRRVLRQHRRLELLRQLPEELADALPPADTVTEADYRSLVTLLAESRRAIRTQEEQRYGDMVDYYTMWAHQIKTPIASMRLTLQNEDSDLVRSLSGDLMRVEQYVEMVLVFLRLDSSTTDYVIRSHSLDDIVRPAVRKFAGGVHPPPSAAGLSAPGPHRGHRRQVAGLRGGAGAVQRPEIHRKRLRDHRHGRR